MRFYDMFWMSDPFKKKEEEKMIEIVPKRCEGCVHLMHRMDGDVRVMDQCYVYDTEITDEMLDELCVFRVEKVKE